MRTCEANLCRRNSFVHGKVGIGDENKQIDTGTLHTKESARDLTLASQAKVSSASTCSRVFAKELGECLFAPTTNPTEGGHLGNVGKSSG